MRIKIKVFIVFHRLNYDTLKKRPFLIVLYEYIVGQIIYQKKIK